MTNLGGVQTPTKSSKFDAREFVHEQSVLGALCLLQDGLPVYAEIPLEEAAHDVHVRVR